MLRVSDSGPVDVENRILLRAIPWLPDARCSERQFSVAHRHLSTILDARGYHLHSDNLAICAEKLPGFTLLASTEPHKATVLLFATRAAFQCLDNWLLVANVLGYLLR
jgi:hypothetical protein